MKSKYQKNTLLSKYKDNTIKKISIYPRPTLTNPKITVKDFKAIVSAENYSETFDLSYVQNTGHANYSASKKLMDEDGNEYYLALLTEGASNFRIDGLVPDNGGWYTDTDIKGGLYDLGRNPAPSYNNWSFSYAMMNDGVYEELLSKALYNLNTALPALNVHVDPNSTNEIELGDYSDTWSGMTYRYVGYFKIELNRAIMADYHGPYETTTQVGKNRWLAVTVHELGHTLGLRDNAGHKPTVYDYDRDGSKCLWLQPNDIYTLKYLYKEKYNLDISGSQEDINAQIPNITNGDTNTATTSEEDYHMFDFSYDYCGVDKMTERADVIVKAKIKYDKTEDINISNTDKPLILSYDVYNIIVENNTMKGNLINNKLKIHTSENLDINEDKIYTLYLKQYENTPCSLINPAYGIKEG